MFKKRKQARAAAERIAWDQRRIEVEGRREELSAEAAGLPAFSNGCVKCGSHDVRLFYRTLYPSDLPFDYIVCEHFEHICSCGHRWLTQTLDFDREA